MSKRNKDKANLLDADNQKTHYWINPKKRRKSNLIGNLWNKIDVSQTHHNTPFIKLFQGKETDKEVENRYELFNRIWNHQLFKIQTILDNENTELFGKLLQYIDAPFDYGKNDTHIAINNVHKIPIGFLLLGSNTANNIRIIQEFNKFVQMHEQKHIKLINLNSKNCANIKSTLREVVKQVLSKKSEENEENDSSDSSEDEESEDEDMDYDGRINYDFDIVEDWCLKQFGREKGNLKNTSSRLIIILQDTDSISTQVLNQLIKLIHSYSNKLPIKLIMGLSSSNVTNWINNNLSNELRILINGFKFNSIDTKLLGFKLIDEAFLNYENDETNPLILNYKLSSIIFNRFKNSNNSIDNLISQFKLSYMIYFYQLPLSVLIDEDFKPNSRYIEALRKLPSFKKHMEKLVFKYNEQKKLLERQKEFEDFNLDIKKRIDPEEAETLKTEITKLLKSNDTVRDLFDDTRAFFKRYRLSVLNLMNIIFKIQEYNEKPNKEKFEIYKLIINNQVKSSVFLKELLVSLKKNLSDFIRFAKSDVLTEEVNGVKDTQLINLRKSLKENTSTDTVLSCISKYIQSEEIIYKLDDNLFNEIFSLDGGSFVNLGFNFEENYENLMINLIRPKLRSILELGLNDSNSYLQNELISEADTNGSKVPAMICQLFKVYKDAPVSINIYDFYCAFKQSLPRELIISELIKNNKGDEYKSIIEECQLENELIWDKIIYAWFLQSCFELINLGLLKEKAKNDYLEKSIWINL
ncbi:uncharacterized protein AC631_02866 [Debaryomyces fabryi]|uniref:Uncharacterized protein n=1 Tax=Debaryomyces fabryi TaxID=58627 RepID=A0A0V1PYN3_9ASCO|nr:uncharacterized protein AC631_02866 [Debaryomyces fabryi]KSA01371.1 hypothetical protein AC631_02866 [Debaryomyces fabryi]CUM55656.1 unnamed protein product [Debaryomyces fabryi]